MKARRIRAVAIGALLLLISGAAVPGQASDQAGISVAVRHGMPLRAAVTYIGPAPGPTGQPEPGALALTALDTRGTATGWSLCLATHGSFRAVSSPGSERPGLTPGGITVLQGNQNLGEHSVLRYRTVAPADTICWTATHNFGDGEYQLVLRGMVIMSPNPAPLTLTISGSAP